MRKLLRWLCPLPLVALACGKPVEPCSNDALMELESRRFAELYAACQGRPSLAECPEAEPVNLKYEALREEWVQCR